MRGRPRKSKDELKSKQVRLRMTEDEYLKLKIASNQAGKNMTDFLMDYIRQKGDSTAIGKQ